VFGPALEEQLRAHGLTLRHFPQSFAYSTLGGWIATRSGGHFASLYTHIMFSNESRAAARYERSGRLWGVCVLYVLIRHLMGSAGCRAARLKSQSAKLTARYTIGAVICSLPRASLRSGARFDLLFG
jgi:hypothetical protein